MTTLYKPVQIESAEQAEALPVGTVAIRLDDKGRAWTALRRCRCEDTDCVAWFSTGRESIQTHKETIGASALVPIEAEEEFQDIDAYEASGHMRRHHLARYVTPWEEA